MLVKIYRDKKAGIDYEKIKRFAEKKIPRAKIELKKNFFENFDLISEREKLESLKKNFFYARVFDVFKKVKHEPFKIDLDFEEKVIRGEKISSFLYDGFDLLKIFYEIIPEGEKKRSMLHIIFLNLIPATFEDRYHARVIIMGNPSLISAHAITKALAMPKEYYASKLSFGIHGSESEILKERFKDRIIDERNSEVITKACSLYVVQAIFYSLYGECHCNDKRCMLYNAHFQEELIAMLKEPKFCEKHGAMLKEFKRLRK